MSGNTKNLRRGNPGNKGSGSSQDRKDAAEVRKISRKLVLDTQYQATLKSKLRDGTLHPSVQTMLWSFAFGKPVELQEEKKAVPVQIEMVLDPTASNIKEKA